jgi:hypothetical protein
MFLPEGVGDTLQISFRQAKLQTKGCERTKLWGWTMFHDVST